MIHHNALSYCGSWPRIVIVPLIVIASLIVAALAHGNDPVAVIHTVDDPSNELSNVQGTVQSHSHVVVVRY